MDFRLLATDGRARAGELTLAHGTVPTPIFMPVGTYGAVKTMAPRRSSLRMTAISRRHRGQSPSNQTSSMDMTLSYTPAAPDTVPPPAVRRSVRTRPPTAAITGR